MRTSVLIGVLTLMITGCGSKPGHGRWNLKVGGEARLVSTDGSEITLQTLGSSAQGKVSRRSRRTTEVKQITLPAGTTVAVLAIDGDDARVEIKEGSGAGSIYWVECIRLEPVSK